MHLRPVLFLYALLMPGIARPSAVNGDPDSLCQRQALIFHALLTLHYDPPRFDERTNAEVIDLFLREADERNIFFLASDREELLALARSVPAPAIFCEAPRRAAEIVSRRLVQIDSISAALSNIPVTLDGSDTLTFVPVSRGRVLCKNLDELSTRISKRIKYECLQAVTSGDRDEMHLLSSSAADRLASAQARAHAKLRRYLAGYRQSPAIAQRLGDCMSNAIARRCDPHSSYFSERGMKEYSSAITAVETSFGIEVDVDENGKAIVSGVTEGSAASRSGIHEGDIISAFSFDGAVPVKVDSVGAENLVEQLANVPASQLHLRLKSESGNSREVFLHAEAAPDGENSVSGFVISGEHGNLGYLAVPAFYTGGKGCTGDVAREIVDLMKDSIRGLLIDLRFNGGGSMREAITLAGLFINEGAVAIYRPRDGEPFPLKDMHRGTLWDGPLVILVNAASASASEFFSAAMQDHDRAIIVGTTTYGKGTAQSVMSADSSGNGAHGFLKITAGKFYRVTGGAVQSMGVVPDIQLPGIAGQYLERENEQPFALASDSVRKRFIPMKDRMLPRSNLRFLSDTRTGRSAEFIALQALNDSVTTIRMTEEKVALSPAEYTRHTTQQSVFQSRLAALLGGAPEFPPVRYSRGDSLLASLRGGLRPAQKHTVESIRKDLVLKESLNILADLADATAPKK